MPVIDGQFGQWETELPDLPNSGGQKTVTIRFTPSAAAPCAAVNLVQTVKTVGIRADGTRVTDPDDVYKDSANGPDAGKHMPEPAPDAAGESVYVDYVACRTDPFYGTPGLRPLDDLQMGSPGSLSDTPGGSWILIKDDIVRIEMTFEVCAICTTSGQCLGCLHWTMTTSRQTQTAPDGRSSEIVVDGTEHPCSTSFLDAMRRYCSNHVKQKDDGTWAWYCPDIDPEFLDAEGNPRSPWGGAISDEFRRRYARSRRVSLGPRTGEGSLFRGDGEALAACLAGPAEAVVKITWSGYQIPTRVGTILTARRGLRDSDIAPFVPALPSFRNDFDELRLMEVEPPFMRAVLRAIRQHRNELRRPERSVRVTVIAGTATSAARAFHGSLTGTTLRAILRGVAPLAGGDAELLEALHYMAANYGGPPPRRRVKGRK